MRAARRLAALAVAALAATAPAQSWHVPERGAVVYQRTTERLAVAPPLGALRPQWIVPGSEDSGFEWRYFAVPRGRAPKDFEQPAFDDSAWRVGRGEFQPDAKAHPHVRTEWRSDVLLLRARVDVGKKKPKALLLRLHHDDGVRVFGNGKLLLESNGYGRDLYYTVGSPAVDALTAGENLFAVQVTNTGGAQYLDVAIAVLATLPPGQKTDAELQEALRAQRDAARRVRDDLFGAFRPPAVLLHGELDAERKRPAQAQPGDLRDLPFLVACDLQKGAAGGAFSGEFSRVFRLGDFTLRGKVTALDAEGWQELDLVVKTTPEPAAGNDSKRFVARFVRPHVRYGFEGRLRIQRRLEQDGVRARIAECRCSLQGSVLRGKDWKETAAELRFDEAFTFAAERDNQDTQFRLDVSKAIDRGVAFLGDQLSNLRAPLLAAEGDEARRSYHSGRLALALLAMIKGGVKKDDAVLQAALQELRGRELIDTYSLGNALVALEAYYAPGGEATDLQAGKLQRRQRRSVPEADLRLMQRWTTQLLDNIDTRVDPEFMLRFNYVRDERYDQSVNQYGLMGLYSAHLCGVPVPATAWAGAINHLLAAQVEAEPPLELELVDLHTLARQQADPDTRTTVVRQTVRPAGWSYVEPRLDGENAPTWGSMTCAGITGLAICQAVMKDLGLGPHKLQGEADVARDAAFGWLARHLTLRCHPGAIDKQQQWFFYFLYGLERAALLSNIALIQGRDWYFEGAMLLTGSQQLDGSWPAVLQIEQDIERTAMAVLFLKRGTAPVLTGK